MDTKALLEKYYTQMDGNPLADDYYERHQIESAAILTNYEDEHAALVGEYLHDRIAGKVVVEVGAGIGLLACHLARHCRRLYAIECDPAWTSIFVWQMYRHKPKNLTFIFGAADDAPHIAADVAFFCTHSGRDSMTKAASRFAPMVIDVYAELMKNDPKYQKLEPFTR